MTSITKFIVVRTNTGSRDQTTTCGFDEEELAPTVRISKRNNGLNIAMNSFVLFVMLFLAMFTSLTEGKEFNTDSFMEKLFGTSHFIKTH